MKVPAQLSIATVLLLAIAGTALSAAIFSEDNLKTFQSLEVDEVATSCGGVLTGESGEIIYKANSAMDRFERCVWFIRPRGKINEFTLGVNEIGFENGQSYRLSVHGLLHGRITPTAWIPTGVGMEEMKETPLLMVTLHTGDVFSNSYGFHFRYFGHEGSQTIVMPSPESTDVIVRNSTFDILRHPVNSGNNYTNLELSTFLFHQSTDVHNPKEETNVALIVEGLESTQHTMVDVLYVYQYTEQNGWQYSFALGSLTDNHKVKHNDMILMVFDTSPSDTDKGFRLAHASHVAC